MLHGDVAYLFILLCYIVFSIRLVYQEGNDARSDDGNDTCNDEQEQAITNSTAHDFAFLAFSNSTDSTDTVENMNASATIMMLLYWLMALGSILPMPPTE